MKARHGTDNAVEIRGTPNDMGENGIHSRLIALELLRGLAAVEVFAGHLLAMPEVPSQLRWLAPLAHFGTEAVILFFVLSGLVIRLSLTSGMRTPRQFGRARLVRIVPAYLVSLAATVMVEWTYDGSLDGANILGHLAFLQTLQGYLVPVLPANPPLWSLSCEMLFYAGATLCIALSPIRGTSAPAGAWRAWTVIALSAVVASTLIVRGGLAGHLLFMVGMSATWLFGFFGIEIVRAVRLDRRQAVFLAALLPLLSRLPIDYYSPIRFLLLGALLVPLLVDLAGRTVPAATSPATRWIALSAIFLAGAHLLTATDSLPGSKLTYLVLPLAAAAAATPIRDLVDYLCDRRAVVVLGFGAASYALYVIHFPILWWVQRSSLGGIAQIVVAVAASATATWLIEWQLQPWVRRRVAA